jgi:hypothetical protein
MRFDKLRSSRPLSSVNARSVSWRHSKLIRPAIRSRPRNVAFDLCMNTIVSSCMSGPSRSFEPGSVYAITGQRPRVAAATTVHGTSQSF